MEKERIKAGLSLLHGWRVRLERKIDKKSADVGTRNLHKGGLKSCCGFDYGIIHICDNVAQIWCANCGHQRGELESRIVEWLLNILAFYPKARKESTPTIRDIDPTFVPLRPRDRDKVYQSAKKRRATQEIRSE